MAEEARQRLELGQRAELRLNPRLYQVMDLLQMPILGLEQHLRQELLSNPFLEMEPTAEEPLEVVEPDETPGDEAEWEELFWDFWDRRSEFPPDESNREPYRPTVRAEVTLYEVLLDQLHCLPLSEREQVIGEEIIGNIDEGGRLACSTEEIAETLSPSPIELQEFWEVMGADGLPSLDGLPTQHRRVARVLREAHGPPDFQAAAERVKVSEGEVEAVLRRVQVLEPSGVGARDLRECLLIQLREAGEEGTLAYRLLRDHFDDFSRRRWSELARSLKIEPEAIQEAADRIALLDPRPGRVYSGRDAEYVVPDFIIEERDGDYAVRLNDGSIPRLRLSPYYASLARDRKAFTGETKQFIVDRFNKAQWMLQAVEQRRQTMLRVMRQIVEHQRVFLRRGEGHLRPLTLREVAEVLGIHESTVSRVVNGKYAQTPRGVYSLKFFFSRQIPSEGDEEISARMIKTRIAEMVEAEDRRNPLSDQAIVDRLKEGGVTIARRTVQKYRDQLGIPPSRLRRRV